MSLLGVIGAVRICVLFVAIQSHRYTFWGAVPVAWWPSFFHVVQRYPTVGHHRETLATKEDEHTIPI